MENGVQIDLSTLYSIEPKDWSQSTRFPTIEVQGGVVNVYVSINPNATDNTNMVLKIENLGSQNTDNDIQTLEGEVHYLYVTQVSGTPTVWTTFVQE